MSATYPIVPQDQGGQTVGEVWVLFMVPAGTSKYAFSNGNPSTQRREPDDAALQAIRVRQARHLGKPLHLSGVELM